MVIFTTTEEKRRVGMTDIQFMSMVKMCLTMAENTRDIKEFRRMLAFPDQGVGHAFTHMLTNMTASLNDMEKVRQVLKDIMLLERSS